MSGHYTSHGGWKSDDAKFRDLTAGEINDLRRMAEETTPEFGGDDNAEWDEHHPVSREVWEKRGLTGGGQQATVRTLYEDIRQAVIDWLGGRYDKDGEFPGNPDYFDDNEVANLVSTIVKLLPTR